MMTSLRGALLDGDAPVDAVFLGRVVARRLVAGAAVVDPSSRLDGDPDRIASTQLVLKLPFWPRRG